jgi:hypothetical protein
MDEPPAQSETSAPEQAVPADSDTADKQTADTPTDTVSDDQTSSEAAQAESPPTSVDEQDAAAAPAEKPLPSSTLHAAEMLVMAKEFMRIFREQHGERRPPSLVARSETGQEALLLQLLRPSQARDLCTCRVLHELSPRVIDGNSSF